MREHSDDTEDPYDCGNAIIIWLNSVMLEASPTTELLLDCFDFDPVKWASMLIQGNADLQDAFFDYTKMLDLRNWFQTQEAYALEYLGPTQSLNAHHSRSWEVASDLICEEVCRTLHKEHPKSGENVATAITHPEIADILNKGEIFDRVFRVKFYLYFYSKVFSGITAIQKYLRDPEHAGMYFVNGGMYASLSIHLLKVVLRFQYSSEDEHGKQKENDDIDTSNDMGDEDMPSPDDKKALDFAISSLPFYLSNADCNPKLVELARSMLNPKMKEKMLELYEGVEYEEIEQLWEAIDLYLKKEPVTPNDAQPNESQAVAARFRTDKRRRESNDDLEVTGAPALSLSSKRIKVMDALSPTEAGSKTGPDLFALADYNISNAALDDPAFSDGHGIDYLSSDILDRFLETFGPREGAF
ncbi:hypothetical protein GALMADRAFT_1256271 [Galerina marginata CBS 339.88]|uniref:Uncharacterized protein n=1 Tax=Galerina marginata (strain CBS 339.88) TaxID=685588 RepID=A0A067THX0_GALM3|nr:hypothetical protein GALMADRAFT_1256271 [Galerina marginata CBS 339.88]